MINKFGLSDSLIDAARKVMAGEKVEEEPKVDEQPEEEQLDEAGFTNRKDNVPAGKELAKRMKAGKGKKTHKWWDDDGDGKGYEKGEVSGSFKKEEVDEVEEDMSVHLSMNKDGKSYTVKKEKTGGRLKKGETISDTHVDDLKDSGVKVHHEEAEQVDEIAPVIAGAARVVAKKVGKGVAKGLASSGDSSDSEQNEEADDYMSPENVQKRIDKAQKRQGKTFFQRYNDDKAKGKVSKTIDKDKFFGKKKVDEEIIDEEMIWDFDVIAEMSEEEFDEIIESLTDEELLELEEGLLGAIGGGIKRAAGGAARIAGRGIKRAGKAAAHRVSVAGRADAAERKQQKIEKKIEKVKTKTADRQRLAQAKAGSSLAKQKLKAAKADASAKKKLMKSKNPAERAQATMPEAVEKALADLEENKKGLKSYKTVEEGKRRGLWDNIHAKRASGRKMNPKGHPDAPTPEEMKKAQESVEQAVDQIDEISRETLGSYVSKASDARGHKGLPTKKVDNRYSGVALASDKLDKKNKEAVKEAAPMATAKQQSGVDRIRKNIAKKKAAGLKLPSNKKDVQEGVGDEEVRSSKQSAALAKHYYMKAKGAQGVGNKEAAAKYMAAAKKFYRKGEGLESKEKEGRPEGQSEANKPVDFMDRPLGVGENYFNELEIEEIMAAEDDIFEVRVTKAAKDEPEHIAMQLRKVVSLKGKHSGVQFNKSTDKVDTKTAQSALSRYNSAKPAEREELQKHMAHSHDALKHVASGGDLSKSPGAKKKESALMSPLKKSDHYN